MKIPLAILYVAIVVLLGAATIVGEYSGTDYAREECYGATWMIVLWFFLALLGRVFKIDTKICSKKCLFSVLFVTDF